MMNNENMLRAITEKLKSEGEDVSNWHVMPVGSGSIQWCAIHWGTQEHRFFDVKELQHEFGEMFR